MENLSFLKLLHHPNIIELLGCYTYRNNHNFLFPLATGGDLSKLLKGQRPESFLDNFKFLVALSGLASAISNVHNFVADAFDLKLAGCHHDLKAGNILIEKDRFILSDFGLSRFKDTTQDSATMFKVRKGYALAPECQDIDGHFEKHIVHRWTDIWSFGCIMLDVLTYMLRGPTGVSEFMTRRKFQVGTNIYYYFHKGDKLNEGVNSWLEELDVISSRSEKSLIQLIKKMLQIDPPLRPTANEVAAEMCLIALAAVAEPILQKYRDLQAFLRTREFFVQSCIEEKRFLSWVVSLRLDVNVNLTSVIEASTTIPVDYNTFQSSIAVLQTLRQEINAILSGTRDPTSRMILPIRRLNTALLDLLPPVTKTEARRLAELFILKTNNIEDLNYIQESHVIKGREARISQLAESKMRTLFAEDKPASMVQNWELASPISNIESIGNLAVGRIHDDVIGGDVKVLIDYKNYDDPSIGEKLLGRMNQIVDLCHAIQQTQSLRILSCRGFFCDKSIAAYGLVYDFPSISKTSNESTIFITLRQIQLEGLRSQQPLLSSRFELARTLASYISELHKIGWVHKGVSSASVAFFYDSQITLLSAFESPYLIGFRHGRPHAAFTEGPASDDDERNYEHPDYSQLNKPFSSKYDYYSLGVVLLEIGLWKCLQSMKVPDGLSPAAFRSHILTVMVPRLGQSMGATYRDVVSVCLGTKFDQNDSIDDEVERKVANQLLFEQEVLLKLSVLSQHSI